MMRQWMATAGLLIFAVPALAEIPVEDYSEPAYEVVRSAPPPTAYRSHGAESERLSMPERMQRLENKMENLTSLNLTTKIEELQQTIQELRGQLEKQTHDLEVLAEQQKTFYKDLNARVDNKPSQAVEVSSAGTCSVPPSVVEKDKTVNSDEHQAYRQAFAVLKSKQYDQALQQFQAYLKNYPKGHYAVNAYYWVGEMNYLQGNHKEARKAFEKVTTQYPGNEKIPDALLKLAIIDIDTGHKQKAAGLLTQIQQKYPGTSAARLAMMRQQELKLTKR